jgi:lysylphosphatidylglycerol synthetase-like protein (DUF2156 family)
MPARHGGTTVGNHNQYYIVPESIMQTAEFSTLLAFLATELGLNLLLLIGMFPDDLSPRSTTKWWVALLVVLIVVVLVVAGWYWSLASQTVPASGTSSLPPVKIQTTAERQKSAVEVRAATATVKAESVTQVNELKPRALPSQADIDALKNMPSPYAP